MQACNVSTASNEHRGDREGRFRGEGLGAGDGRACDSDRSNVVREHSHEVNARFPGGGVRDYPQMAEYLWFGMCRGSRGSPKRSRIGARISADGAPKQELGEFLTGDLCGRGRRAARCAVSMGPRRREGAQRGATTLQRSARGA
jgi:hypothetical protein